VHRHDCQLFSGEQEQEGAVLAPVFGMIFGSDGRGLHSSTFQLNLSAFYGIGWARRGCVARVEGVLWGV